MNKGDIKYFLKYFFMKPFKRLHGFARKPSNWRTVILLLMIFVLVSETIRAGFDLKNVNIPLSLFFGFIIALVFIEAYKEWIAGDWKHNIRENYYKPKK